MCHLDVFIRVRAAGPDWNDVIEFDEVGRYSQATDVTYIAIAGKNDAVVERNDEAPVTASPLASLELSMVLGGFGALVGTIPGPFSLQMRRAIGSSCGPPLISMSFVRPLDLVSVMLGIGRTSIAVALTFLLQSFRISMDDLAISALPARAAPTEKSVTVAGLRLKPAGR